MIWPHPAGRHRMKKIYSITPGRRTGSRQEHPKRPCAADISKGKYKDCHIGRAMTRASGYFDIRTTAEIGRASCRERV